MNRSRKICTWTPEEENREQTGLPAITQNKPKINRLKRSPRTSQTLKSDFRSETDFKTPTRVSKVGFRTPATDESPNNDSEFQHEIIWDPTSPWTPVRTGRGRRRTAVFKSVDIADIANRIAPKSKQPEEAESSLLQWIGDTAIPCTPEIRKSRTKPKPTRQNPVEDLLKLAKQFDFNMIQQEEAHLRPNPRNSTETTHEDQDLFFDEPQASPQTRSEAQTPPRDTKTNCGDPLDDLVLQEMDDDLDLLFESSTQNVSDFSACSHDVVPHGVTRVGGASDLNTVKQAADDFDDDWSNDDLLEDSLVMEMTQNPELFSVPQHSSTQKQTNKNYSASNTVPPQNADKHAKSGEVQRFSQTLERFPHGQSWNKATGNASQVGFHAGDTLSQVLPSCKVPSIVPGSHGVSKTAPQPKKTVEIQPRKVQPTAPSSSFSRSDPLRSVHSSTELTIPSSKITEKKKNHKTLEDDVLTDLVSEDLDSIFASDDIWDDDGADDDALFWEACEKVEVMTERPPKNASESKPTPQTRQRTTDARENAFLQPNDRNRAPSSTGVPPGTRHNNTSAPKSRMTQSSESRYKFSHVKTTTGTGSPACNAAGQVYKSVTATTVQSYRRIQDDQFTKHHSTFNNAAPAVSKDVTRCSDAEIEKKKQQAMERRRLRLLANQNLRAPV